ncbi:hypothetical protein D3C85_1076640 [compost metagenome]
MFLITTNGVPPFDEIVITCCAVSSGKEFPACCAIFFAASCAPFRILVPSFNTTPEVLVSAVNFIVCEMLSVKCEMSSCILPFKLIVLLNSIILFPSGVSSASELKTADFTNSSKETPFVG